MRISRRTALTSAAASFAFVGRASAQVPVVPPADRELRVPVSGGEIYVRVNGDPGSRKAPLLLIHGGPGGACWQMFPALPLASDRAIVVYDQLDSGRSDAPGNPANWTIDRYVSEIDAIRAALQLDRLHILGHSWGGMLAARYASGSPPGLKSLILQGTPLSAERWRESVAGLLPALPGDAGTVIATHEAAGTTGDPAYQEAVGIFFRRHLARTRSPAYAPAYMTDVPLGRGDALAEALVGLQVGRFTGTLKTYDDEALLTRIATPTLMLCGEHDVISPHVTRAMAAASPNSRVEVVADAGHMAQFDQPEAWRRAVSMFIGAHNA